MEETTKSGYTQEKKETGTLELQTQYGNTVQVSLSVNTYMNNDSLYVGMTTMEDGFREPYGNVTVNLSYSVPPYCAFVDTNNMPELEDFLVRNRIAEFTGLEQQSGFVNFPLYLFHADRLRELCPDGMREYEQKNDLIKEDKQKGKSR